MGKLLAVASDRARKADDVVASGAALEMRYREVRKPLSLDASKLLHLGVRVAGARLGEAVKHEVLLSELRVIGHRSAVDIRRVALELVTTAVEVREPGRRSTLYGPVWDVAEVPDDAEGDGRLVFRFSEAMLKVLNADDRWAILSRQLVLDFQSRYALRLYEILTLRRDRDLLEETFTIKELRDRLGVPHKKLISYSDLRVKVIDAALTEINARTDLTVSYQAIKKGRAVVAVRLSWRVRKAAVIAGPKGQAPEEAFPTSGSIAYSAPWAFIAKTSGGGWDVDRIATAFREHAEAKGIPLRGAKVQSTFEGFCKAYVERHGKA